MSVRVVDERSERTLRTVIGELLVDATRADIALAKVRLAALDLTKAEVQGPALCRVLLGQLDASTLADAATESRHSRQGLHRLAGWLTSDRLEVRSAGLGAWAPDFSVFETRSGILTSLIGAHYFGIPQLAVGPSVTVIDPRAETAGLLRGRFEELWARAHDVAPAILTVLERTGRTKATGSGIVNGGAGEGQ